MFWVAWPVPTMNHGRDAHATIWGLDRRLKREDVARAFCPCLFAHPPARPKKGGTRRRSRLVYGERKTVERLAEQLPPKTHQSDQAGAEQ